MSHKRAILIGALLAVVAVPSAVTVAKDAPQPLVPTALPAGFEKTEASKIVGNNALAHAGENAVTRVEGNGEVCGVTSRGSVSCGKAEGLDKAPLVDVTLGDNGTVEVSVIAGTETTAFSVVDIAGKSHAVKLKSGAGAVSVPRGNVKIQWTDGEGKTRSDDIPVERMFPPVDVSNLPK